MTESNPPKSLQFLPGDLSEKFSHAAKTGPFGRLLKRFFTPLFNWAGLYILTTDEVERDYAKNETLLRSALYDHLTGLPNRLHFMTLLGERVRETRRYRDKKAAVIYIDLDDFKTINDTEGHKTGDEALIVVGNLLRGVLSRETDTVARLGGDEFAVLIIAENKEKLPVEEVVTDLRKAVDSFIFNCNGRSYPLAASIGTALINQKELLRYPIASTDQIAREILHVADMNMYADKQRRQKIRHSQGMKFEPE